MNTVIEYLESKNIEYKKEGTECVIICPNCRKPKLYINTKTLLYHCFRCEAEDPDSKYSSGHFSNLQTEWGDIIPVVPTFSKHNIEEKEEKDFTKLVRKYNYNLLNTKDGKKGLKYLYKRGFDHEDIERFNFGFVSMKNEKWISIPAFENNVAKLIKYRKITNNDENIKKYEREYGSKSIVYNQDILSDYSEVYICAGEFDTAIMIKNGYENSVCGTVGEGTLSPYMYDKLYQLEKFILIMDSDKVGQQSAKNIWSKRLGIDRCWNVVLPEGHDVNSYFLEHTKEEFEELLKKAYQFKVAGVSSLNDVFYDMYNKSLNKTLDVLPLPWNSLNGLIGGGLEKKNLNIIGGIAGSGKTSLTLQIAHHFAKEHSMPSLITCLEMSEIKLATKIVQLEKDLTYDEVNYSHALMYAKDLEDLSIYFAYSPTISGDIYFNTVREARNRYGCELFIFDNLQLLVTSDKESDYAIAVKMFKRIVMELDVIMVLVSQPRKLNAERAPTYDDLKGSAAISQAGDLIMLMYRRRKNDGGATTSSIDSFVPKTQIIVDKARFSSGGKTLFNFIGAKSRFEEWEEN